MRGKRKGESMTAKRLFQTLMLYLHRGSKSRAQYLKENHIFSAVGENFGYQPRVIPLYPELIRFHDNVFVAANVSFVVHDTIHIMLNAVKGEAGNPAIPEKVGAIEVMDNVFIGSGTRILGNVRIGENVIIGAGTLVNHDLAPYGVYAGIPARKIGDFADFVNRRKKADYPFVAHNQHITEEEIRAAWEDFYRSRNVETL